VLSGRSSQLWKLYDLTHLLCVILYVVMFAYYVISISAWRQDVMMTGKDPANERWVERCGWGAISCAEDIQCSDPSKQLDPGCLPPYVDLLPVASIFRCWAMLSAIIVFSTGVRIFKFLKISSRMSMLSATLAKVKAIRCCDGDSHPSHPDFRNRPATGLTPATICLRTGLTPCPYPQRDWAPPPAPHIRTGTVAIHPSIAVRTASAFECAWRRD
jgi:hypothetical protein